jgi:hypothetical protein
MSRTETRRTNVIVLAFWILIAAFAAAAFAEQQSNPRICSTREATEKVNRCTLPWPDTIEAQTDITAFMQSGVPAELQIAALRRAWSVDPAIRDYRGLQENDWDFDHSGSIPGFGDLGPDYDVRVMLAGLFSEPPIVLAARMPSRPDYVYDSIFLLLANWMQRTVKGIAS